MYHMILGESLINIGACVRVCVCMCVWERVFHITPFLVCPNLNEAVVSESSEVPLVLFLVLAMYASLSSTAHLQIAPDGVFIKHTRLISVWTFIQD